LLFTAESESLFIGFLLFWGMVVIADSPLFSTLVAENAPAEIKATALTIVNCIGFSITIISILILNILQASINPIYIYPILAIGPILGLIALYDKKKQHPTKIKLH
jgi:MFS family permease